MRETERGWEDYYRNAPDAAWSETPDPKVLELVRRRERRAAPFRSLKPIRVADLCCGDGRNLAPWVGKAAALVGVDVAPTACARAAHRVEYAVILVGDVANTGLAAGTFDLVQCFDGIPHVPAEETFREAARLLRPSGLFAFNVFTPDDVAWGEGECVGNLTWSYRGTVFRFFREPNVRAALPPELEVVSVEHRRWTDPPHPPFRPAAHIHDGLTFVCRRTGNVSLEGTR